MKKIVLMVLVLFGLAFASEEFKGCDIIKVSEDKSIISCQYGDYEATYSIDNSGKRSKNASATIIKIGEPIQVIQNIYQK